MELHPPVPIKVRNYSNDIEDLIHMNGPLTGKVFCFQNGSSLKLKIYNLKMN